MLDKLTEQQKKALNALARADLMSVHELAKELGITPASASQTISGLYLKKLIARTGSGRSVRWKAVSTVKEKFTNEHF